MARGRRPRGETELSYCKEKGTNAHYLRFCREPIVVTARGKHHSLHAAAIHTCKLKKSTANALTVVYDLNNLGRHIDPGSKEDGSVKV